MRSRMWTSTVQNTSLVPMKNKNIDLKEFTYLLDAGEELFLLSQTVQTSTECSSFLPLIALRAFLPRIHTASNMINKLSVFPSFPTEGSSVTM